MRWYVEHRAQSERIHSLWFRPLQDEWAMGADTRSVYAYPEEIVENAKKHQTLAGLRNPLLRADWLFIDVDSGVNDVLQVERALQPWTYEKWVMGIKERAHFHIPLATPLITPYVVDAQVKWLKDTLGNDAPIDWSIYTVTGQFRMPGTINSKRLAVKTLGHRHHGDLLHLVPVVPDPKQSSTIHDEIENPRELLTWLLTREEDGRGRHRHLWRICQPAALLGMTEDEVVDAALKWNHRWASSPLPDREVILHVRRTYRRAI